MALVDDLNAVNVRWAKSIGEGNAVAASRYFTDDGTVVAMDTPTKQGPAELSALFQSWIDAGIVGETYSETRAEILGNAGLLFCRYEATIKDATGTISFERGRNSQVFVKSDSGQWKIKVLAITTDSL